VRSEKGATLPFVIPSAAEGDSITNGGGAATTEWWPSFVSGVSAQYTIVNEGLSGAQSENRGPRRFECASILSIGNEIRA
jgi:hypothetical protein